MKKLKLYGTKKLLLGFFDRKGFIAEVFVDPATNELVVISSRSQLRDDLIKKLQNFIKSGDVMLKKSISDKDGHTLSGVLQHPGDEKFLEALKGSGPFWWDKKFDGYEINEVASKIVDE